MNTVRVLTAAVGALLPLAASASPPIFHVDSLADVPASANVYDGVCETAPGNGVCTLRAAVMEANYVPAGGATILVPIGTYYLSLAPTDTGSTEDGDLDLLKPMTVQGEGPSATIIDGNAITRVFFSAAADVRIQGLTIRNGNISGLTAAAGVANWSGLTLENVVVSGNQGSLGGGVYNQGNLTVRHCIIENNTAVNSGGGIYNSSGTTLIQDSIVKGNFASDGAGIYNAADMTIERTSIIGNLSNSSFGNGGGVYSNAPDGSSLVMVNDEVSLNSSRRGGGGIYVYDGVATLINLTVTTNLANSSHEQQVSLSQGGPFGGGIGLAPSASVFLKNSIVAGNQSGGAGSTFIPDECGPTAILSGDYNIRGAWLECYLTGQTAHVNHADVDPGLTGLAQNGGFGSDQFAYYPTAAIPPVSCTDQFGAPLAVDRRGYQRPSPPYAQSHPNCDIGAAQAQGNYAPSQLLGVELLRNGGAAGNELGVAATNTSEAAPPYWYQPGGLMSQVVYGSSGPAAARSEAPAGSGSYFFSGGNSELSTSDQFIDVSALALQIDAGQLGYATSGAFGGAGSSEDYATLSLIFSDGVQFLGNVTIGGFTPADRGYATKLLPASRRGVLPVGTRYIAAELTATRTHGADLPYNSGYADDLSLRLPEPAAAPLAAAVLAALALLSALRNPARRG